MRQIIFQKKVSFSESEVNMYPDENNNEELPILLEGDKMVQDCVHGQTKTFSDKCPICILFKLNEKLDKMAAERAKGGLISEKFSNWPNLPKIMPKTILRTFSEGVKLWLLFE